MIPALHYPQFLVRGSSSSTVSSSAARKALMLSSEGETIGAAASKTKKAGASGEAVAKPVINPLLSDEFEQFALKVTGFSDLR